MNRRRPILFWPVLVFAVCATVWWAFHVPYAPQKIYSAIPVQATFLSVHRNLAGRWDEVSANPLTQSLLAAANMSESDWRGLNRDPQYRDWLNRLASDDLTLAYVPNLAEGEPGWVFASWLGGRSQRLRLALQWSEIPGIKFAGTRRGWPMWIATSTMFKGGECLAFSLVEGMLVGSYAKSPVGMDTVLACVDGRYPSLAIHTDGGAIPPADASDRGWFRIPDPKKGFFDSPRLQFSLSTFSSNRLGGVVRAPFAWLDGAGTLPSAAPDSPAKWQTDLPSAVLIAPSRSAVQWITQTGTDLYVRAFADLIREQTGGPLYASLFTGDYRGAMFGLKFPTLIVAAASTNAADMASRLSGQLARLNSEYPWGLAQSESTADFARVWTVAATGATFYAQSERGEQIGFATGSNWVLAASSVSAFTNILRDAVLRESRPARLSSASQSAARGGAAAYLWFNLPEASPAVRMAVGQYALRLKIENKRESQLLRLQINDGLNWLDSLKPLGSVEFWARPSAGATEIRFETSPFQ